MATAPPAFSAAFVAHMTTFSLITEYFSSIVSQLSSMLCLISFGHIFINAAILHSSGMLVPPG